jgi:rRNA-processing protein FCF1
MGKKWSEYQRLFDKHDNVDEIFYFLRDLVDELQICENATCPIFPNLFDLDKERTDYEFKTLVDAKVSIKNTVEFQKYQEKFMQYLLKAKTVMAEIYALKVSVGKKEALHMQYHDEYLETLRIINENNYPMPLSVETAAQAKMDEIAVSAIGLDQRLEEKRKVFQKVREEMKEQKKLEKKHPEALEKAKKEVKTNVE